MPSVGVGSVALFQTAHCLNTLADFTNPSLLVPASRSSTAQDILVELCSLLHRHGSLGEHMKTSFPNLRPPQDSPSPPGEGERRSPSPGVARALWRDKPLPSTGSPPSAEILPTGPPLPQPSPPGEGDVVAQQRDSFYDAVMARELISPTSFVPGWALPHARLRGLRQLSFTLARCPQALTWFGNPGASVQTVLLFAIPDAEAKTYLNLIASVARLTQSPELLDQLDRSRDAETMLKVLGQVPLRRLGAAGPNSTPVTLISRPRRGNIIG